MSGLDDKIIQALQILAIESVEEPNEDHVYRGICRWYSTTFNTALDRVENELDPIYVLTHFFEYNLGQLANSSDDKDMIRYEQQRQNVLFPETAKSDDDKLDDWIKKLEQDYGKKEDNSSKSLGKKLGAEMADKVANVIKNKMDELNLKGEGDLSLPDSGSMGE